MVKNNDGVRFKRNNAVGGNDIIFLGRNFRPYHIQSKRLPAAPVYMPMSGLTHRSITCRGHFKYVNRKFITIIVI